jgi:hypothetical protein
VGVSIGVDHGNIGSIAGRVQMLAPGLGCYVCGGLLDWDAVRRDLMTEAERRADAYYLGSGEPQPAVMSINSTVSSLAVTMFLGALVGVPTRPRFLLYDALGGKLRDVMVQQRPECTVCGRNGALARGGEWPLPVREQ